MLDNLKLSDRLLVAQRWVEQSASGELPPITEHPRVFITLLEECRTAALALEPADPPPPVPVEAVDVHPVSDVYVPDEPSRGFLKDMGRPSTLPASGLRLIDRVRFRRHLRLLQGGAQ